MPIASTSFANIHFQHPDWICMEVGETHLWTRGWVEQGGRFLDAEAMGWELAAITGSVQMISLPEVADRIKGWIGNFAFCVVKTDEVLLGVDVVRTLPLQYARGAAGLFISDSHDWLAEAAGCLELNESGAEEYLVSGFVYGGATLHQGIFSMQAGEILRLDRTSAVSHRYFTFNPDSFQNPELRLDARTFERLDDRLLAAIRRMLGSVRNVDRWIVPLSGGYDSRIVASGLRRLGVANVLCISYGRVGNKESEISQQVAEALGFDWRFAEYNRANWTKRLADPQTQKYVRYACNGNSLPVMQDFLALTQLKESGVLREGDVIVPGHTLDFLSGSHLDAIAVESGETSVRKASLRVVERHGAFWWDERGQEEVRRRVQILLEQASEDVRGRTAAAMIERFDWQERQAKFIVNNVRAYEFLGFQWRLPLWDQELVAWWKAVPVEHRLGRRLLREAFQTTLVVPEVRGIPVHGVLATSGGDPSRKASPPFAVRARALAKAIGTGNPWTRWILSTLRRRVQPRSIETTSAAEERFADQADTVDELLSSVNRPLSNWPRPLRRHFRGREKWTVRQSGTGANALFAAYVLKPYMQES